MKIALIAPEFLPNWGGVGTYCVELAKRLSYDKNIDVHVITLKRRIKGSRVEYSESEILNYFDNKINLHILSNAEETFLYNFDFQYQLYRRLPQIVKENKIDLIHSQHAHMSDILTRLKSKSSIKAPNITTIHSTIKTQYQGIKVTHQARSEMDQSEKFELALHPLLLLAERFYLKNSRYAIFVSKWTKDHVLSKYKYSNLTGPVIHNGVDPNQYSPLKANNSAILNGITDPIILYASRLTVARGAHIFAHAIPLILKKNKNVHFVFAGSGDITPILNILHAERVQREKVTFLGYVDYADLPSLYARAFAYVMPTSWENLPFKLLEAMSSGVPVITTDVGGIPEVVQNNYNGIYVPRSAEGFMQGVVKLLENKEFAMSIGKNARASIIENFTWDKTIFKTKDLYHKVLGY